jgi:hypothetical protein
MGELWSAVGATSGPAATAYREFHRAATEDAVRIREVMKLREGP